MCNKNDPWRFCQFVASLQFMNQPFCTAERGGGQMFGEQQNAPKNLFVLQQKKKQKQELMLVINVFQKQILPQ